jgi:hypothetical protein
VANAFRGSGSEPYKVADFMPEFGVRAKSKVRELARKLKQLFAGKKRGK